MCSSILVQSLATPRELDLVEERTCPLELVTSTLKVSESSCKTVSKAFLRLIVSGITKTTPLGSVDVKSNCGIQIYHWLVTMVVAFIWTNFCMCRCFVNSGLMSCSPLRSWCHEFPISNFLKTVTKYCPPEIRETMS